MSIKHYLRGEDGIYYRYSLVQVLYIVHHSCGTSSDLYYLVKFLPAYALPAGMPSMSDLHAHPSDEISPISPESPTRQSFTGAMVQSAQGQVSPTSPVRQAAITIAPPPLSSLYHRSPQQGLPPPVSIGSPGNRSSFLTGLTGLASAKSPATMAGKRDTDRQILQRQDESYLLPAKLPPKYGLFDIFPFSLLINFLTARGREVKGKKAARFRAKLKNVAVSHNLPLEISLYLVFSFLYNSILSSEPY